MNKLYLVPTPVGNLEDITLRALRMLKEVDLILAEDTRITRKLLKHYEISTPMESHHAFNEHKKVDQLAERILKGERMALVSDAGTPAISDPGYLLVKACLNLDLEIECLPGPTAMIPALVVSGLPADRFCFEGFLPHKKGRQTRISQYLAEKRTIVLYESPHRLLRTLNDLKEQLGDQRRCSVSREISKIHEQTVRGNFEQLVGHFTQHPPKGEMVVIIAPPDKG